jgi:hypothetical protein
MDRAVQISHLVDLGDKRFQLVNRPLVISHSIASRSVARAV